MNRRKKNLSITSKVIFDDGRHITAADYGDKPVVLGSINVTFPQINSLQARALRRLISEKTLSHRGFDSATRSYRLSGYIERLRMKGWVIINHDSVEITTDVVPRKALFTRYELYARLDKELSIRIKAFCEAVDRLETPIPQNK